MFIYWRISAAIVLVLLALAVVSAQRMGPALLGDATTAAASGGWAGYNKGYDGQRFAALDQINTTNVSQLKPLCELTMGEGGTFQTGPVVIGNTMFLTTARSTVSMNATTCAVNWRQVDARELSAWRRRDVDVVRARPKGGGAVCPGREPGAALRS